MDTGLSKLQEMVGHREAWRAAVHGDTKSQARLNNWTTINVSTSDRCSPVLDAGHMGGGGGVVCYTVNEQSFHTRWVSYNSAQVWVRLPGDSNRFYWFRALSHKTTSLFRCQSQVQVLIWLLTDWLKQVLTTPSSGSINLLKLFTELRTFYLLDHWFIVKGYNLAQPDERDA